MYNSHSVRVPVLGQVRPKWILIDLWKTLARSTYPEPIADFQEILGYKTVMTAEGPKTELCPEFLEACLTTNIEDPDLFMAAIAERFGIREIPADASQRFRKLIENEKNGLSLFLDVQGELRALKDQGYNLALASNVWPFPTKHLLKRAGLEHLFDALILSYEVGYAKPHPEFWRRSVSRLGVSLDECMMIGDNVRLDIRGALAVGIPRNQVVHIDRYGDSTDTEPGVLIISELAQLYRDTTD